jgi:hypothetical protein
MRPIPNGFRDRAIWADSGLAWTPSIVLPSRHAAPLYEACEYVEFSNINYKLYQLCHLNNKTVLETVRSRNISFLSTILLFAFKWLYLENCSE